MPDRVTLPPGAHPLLASGAMSTDNGGERAPARGGANDYRGRVRWSYRPELDGDPDPGEVVWAWVAFEDDPRIGKDRPLAIVGHAEDGRLVALMLSSRNRTGHPSWLAIGPGPWDRTGRPSWVRCDRLLAVPANAVRREGAVLPPRTFDAIVAKAGGRVTAGPRRQGLLTRLVRLVRRGKH